MKKPFALALLLLLLLSLTACGGSPEPAAPTAAPTVAPTVAPAATPTPAPTAVPAPTATPLVMAPSPQYAPWKSYTLLVSNALEEGVEVPEGVEYVPGDGKLVVIQVQSSTGTFWMPDVEENLADFNLRGPNNVDYPVAYIVSYGDPADVIDFAFEIPADFPLIQCIFMVKAPMVNGSTMVRITKLFE